MKRMFSKKHILIFFLFSILLLLASQPSTFFYNNVKLDSIVQSDIVAPKSTTYVDERATQELKDEALKEIKNVYDRDLSVSETSVKQLNTFLEGLLSAKDEVEDKDKSIDKVASEIKVNYDLNKEEIVSLMNEDAADLKRANRYLQNKLKKTYDGGVREENLEGTINEFKNDSNLYLFGSSISEVLVPKIIDKIKSNEVLNEEETERQKNATLEKITPVYKKIALGEIIARKDDKISQEQMQKLEALDMINSGFKWKDFIRHYPNILLFMVLFHLFCAKFAPEHFESKRKYAFTMLIVTIVTLLSQIFSDFMWLLIPFVTALIIFAVFWGRKFVVVAAVFMGFLINGDDYIYTVLSSIIGISLSFLYNDFRKFTDAIRTGTILGVIISVSYFILYYSLEQRLYIEESLVLIFSGILSGIIANGIIPLIENILGMATIYKLTELNKYDHPILEEMYRKAKGTYDHSRNVSHLCSSASKKIGANTLLLKVAALYHDIGKMEKPEFFIENSSPEANIHNELDPWESAQIILGHPERSVQLCEKYKIPKEVIDVIHSHHGDSTLLHFYQKALEIDPNALIGDFTYRTPTPKTKEQGILLLADSTEAYSRSLVFANYQELEKQVKEFIHKKIKSGILKDCELSTRDIGICVSEFSNAIYATHHQRVKYITDKVESD